MNSQLQALLNQRIQSFAADITTLLQSAVAEAVANSLGGTSVVVKRGPGRPPNSAVAAKAGASKSAPGKRGPGRPPKAAVSGAAPAKRGPGRPPNAVVAGAAAPAKKTRGRRKGEKRTNAELERLTEALFREITREGGRRIEQIGVKMGVPTKDLALPVKKLLDGKRIRTKGQRRATSYTAN
jgi:hypothetical protein